MDSGVKIDAILWPARYSSMGNESERRNVDAHRKKTKAHRGIPYSYAGSTEYEARVRYC